MGAAASAADARDLNLTLDSEGAHKGRPACPMAFSLSLSPSSPFAVCSERGGSATLGGGGGFQLRRIALRLAAAAADSQARLRRPNGNMAAGAGTLQSAAATPVWLCPRKFSLPPTAASSSFPPRRAYTSAGRNMRACRSRNRSSANFASFAPLSAEGGARAHAHTHAYAHTTRPARTCWPTERACSARARLRRHRTFGPIRRWLTSAPCTRLRLERTFSLVGPKFAGEGEKFAAEREKFAAGRGSLGGGKLALPSSVRCGLLPVRARSLGLASAGGATVSPTFNWSSLVLAARRTRHNAHALAARGRTGGRQLRNSSAAGPEFEWHTKRASSRESRSGARNGPPARAASGAIHYGGRRGRAKVVRRSFYSRTAGRPASQPPGR